VRRFVGRGLADFIGKPFLAETLIKAIAAGIARTAPASEKIPGVFSRNT
jgi:FixJ family two-component response regulator